jgi:adenine-specific DNA-methyltransferase
MSLGYLGSKKSLITFIEEKLGNHLSLNKKYTFADLFAGTGFVGNYFHKKYNYDIISNDMEYYSYILNYANLKSLYNDKLEKIIEKINNREYKIDYDNLIKRTYTPFETCERMYFTINNGDFIDYCMNVIIYLKNKEKINNDEEIFLKASLLIRMDKVANTSCVYGAYLKKYKKTALKELKLLPLHTNTNNNCDNIIYNSDILDLKLKTDICYLDPPYNTRQYGNNYSQLNYILKYDDTIEIKGKTGIIKNWNRSLFCSKKSVTKSLETTLKNIESNYLLFSYNNEGLLKKQELTIIFLKYYKNVTLYEQIYKKFKAQQSVKKKQVIEYLFICDNNDKKIEDEVEEIGKSLQYMTVKE